MTEEDKKLLFKDLSARLPYGVKCVSGVDDATLIIEGINPNCNGASEVQVTYERSGINFDTKISSIKPYLFPLSSMTEEHRKELEELHFGYMPDEIFNDIEFVYHYDCINLINWCYKNHLDINDFIPRGLAIDATGLNIY